MNSLFRSAISRTQPFRHLTTSSSCKMARPDSPAAQHESTKLSQEERRAYSRLSVIMEQFHNNFRRTWKILYAAVSPDEAPSTNTLSASRLIGIGMEFVEHLTIHHNIEETYIFPVLAKRMHAFRPDQFAYTQHKGIHEGIDKLEAYLKACRHGQRELRREELKEILDSFGSVLWQHLDDEVEQLSPEKLKAAFTLEEVLKIPI